MKEYNIGLDIGTNSVGWAVVLKDSYKVMRKGNKALWGIRLFDDANTAVQTRGYRSTRRRMDRRKERILLLREIFAEEIGKVDPHFFDKLEESFYHNEDKKHKHYPLTKEDKLILNRFKTIYHLRNHIMESEKKEDIRLIYLAFHHIIKYRGNFLHEENDFNVKNIDIEGELKNTFEEIFSSCDELSQDLASPEEMDFASIEEILDEKSKSDRRKKLELYLKDFSGEYPKFATEFSKAVVGNKFSAAKLFHLELEQDQKDVEVSLDGSSLEDKGEELDKLLGDKISVLETMKSLYEMIYLKNIFKGRKDTSISHLMMERYEIHKQDLKDLKDLLSLDTPMKGCVKSSAFHKVFRTRKHDKDLCLYEQYLHNKITLDEFVNELKKVLKEVKDTLISNGGENLFHKVEERMMEEDYMPRITSIENGSFPYQLNLSELEKMIENQGKYYPFLLEKVGKDYKISKLLSFRIPYYVGPLIEDEKHPFAWMKRKIENVKITPYNFDEVVDKDASAERFITKMLRSCSYLLKEKAMPANSLLYSEYKVLNELKQIRINGHSLTVEMQQEIIDEFFRKTLGTLTDKKFKEYLNQNRNFDMYGGDFKITGYSAEEKFANTLTSYIDFYGPEGFFKGTNLTEEDAETIIRWITIFEDKTILKRKIEMEYPVLVPVLPKILKKRYSGWSNLSKKLLTELRYFDPEDSNYKSIMDLMWETSDNFMQILNDEKYGFQEMIAKENGVLEQTKLNYDLVKQLTTSPATKRGIWQALQVVKEVTDYIGYDPSSISIEFERGDEKKGRKDSRKDYLKKLYTANKDFIHDYQRLSHELENTSEDELKNSEKLYLYFIQESKSLYSGTQLTLDDLKDCEVDHILPRTAIKDDSIDNKALVLSKENRDKAANLVLFPKWQSLCEGWWKHLEDVKLISNKKFRRLMRRQFKEEDIEGFINRQLVETRQITKHVANILQGLYPNSKINYMPAALGHSYREKFELFKFRDLNDYHHAHDAYLVAVLGEYKSFCNLKVTLEDLKELSEKLWEEGKYKELRYGYVINSIDSSFPHFNAKTGEVLDIDYFTKTVADHLYRNDILVSKKTEIREGEFYQQNASKKGVGTIPFHKGLDVKLYGGYTRANPSYAMVVKYTKKGKNSQRMIGLPMYVLSQKDEDLTKEYIRNLLNLKPEDSIELVGKKIPFYTLLNWNGQMGYLVGSSDTVELCNAKEFQLTKAESLEYKYMLNRLLNHRKRIIDDVTYTQKLKDFLKLLIAKIEKEYLLYQNLVSEMKELFFPVIEEAKIETMENVIIQMLYLLKCNSTCANLKFLGASTAFGKKNHRIIENATIIHQSVTGIRERRYEF